MMKRILTFALASLLLFALACTPDTAAPTEAPASEATPDSETATVPVPAELPEIDLAELPTPEPEPSPEEQILGEWYVEQYGVVMTLTLNADGTYLVSSPVSEPMTGTWALADGFLWFDGTDGEPLNVLGDELKWETASLYFSREKPETYTPADVIENAPLALFGGYWKSAYAEINGVLIPADALDDNTDVYIEDNHVALGGSLFGDTMLDFTYENGALSFDLEGISIRLEPLYDGFLRLTLASDAPMILYLDAVSR